jgi:hypothetical protein
MAGCRGPAGEACQAASMHRRHLSCIAIAAALTLFLPGLRGLAVPGTVYVPVVCRDGRPAASTPVGEWGASA